MSQLTRRTESAPEESAVEAAADELEARLPQAPQKVPDSRGLRLLAVHAHPDDESSKGAAMMAAYAAAGAEVIVATATGGEAGTC